MRKNIFLFLIYFLLLFIGCKEKPYVKELHKTGNTKKEIPLIDTINRYIVHSSSLKDISSPNVFVSNEDIPKEYFKRYLENLSFEKCEFSIKCFVELKDYFFTQK